MKTCSIFFVCSLLLLSIPNVCSPQSEDLNLVTVDKNGREKLLGQVNKDAFMANSFKTWFSTGFDQYQVDSTTLEPIKKKFFEHHIKVFMGTWCGDSKREIPRFYKILEAIDFPKEQLQMIAVDNSKANYKKSPGGEEKGRNITKVPTFIFYNNGKEVNRIVESPIKSLEKDIVAIISGKKYIPNYSTALVLPQD
ncbi:TlpA family protein disulfide reductase [Costertonia aggregata]|uniref:Thioredoxin family protein n=1 Tax=Costertonia aggregata TaxID=343403 RepID=A0A7H9APE1_9FLAO|nr:thioredoxin family protein [Costertonia aggregata]QLG45329.1 thioredoxin family protein [Costertonia aggregata]